MPNTFAFASHSPDSSEPHKIQHNNNKPVKPDPEEPYTPTEPDEPDVQPEIIGKN